MYSSSEKRFQEHTGLKKYRPCGQVKPQDTPAHVSLENSTPQGVHDFSVCICCNTRRRSTEIQRMEHDAFDGQRVNWEYSIFNRGQLFVNYLFIALLLRIESWPKFTRTVSIFKVPFLGYRSPEYPPSRNVVANEQNLPPRISTLPSLALAKENHPTPNRDATLATPCTRSLNGALRKFSCSIVARTRM